MILLSGYQPVVIVPTDWPTFWVGLATAVSTFLAVVVAAILGIRAVVSENKRRDGYAAEELNRQAELQAILVRAHRDQQSVTPAFSAVRILFVNDSSRPVYNIRIGVRLDGEIRWSPVLIPDLAATYETWDTFPVNIPGPEVVDALAEFTDAYRRVWQLDAGTLTLVRAADIRGTREVRDRLRNQVG